MSLTEIFAILIIHWFADFVMQTDSQAKGKSKNWGSLLSHTVIYSLVFFAIGGILLSFTQQKDISIINFEPLLIFVIVTFICHTSTDYYTSRLNSKLWSEGKVHHFFVSVGFDQVLHYIQLFTTYWLLTK